MATPCFLMDLEVCGVEPQSCLLPIICHSQD